MASCVIAALSVALSGGLTALYADENQPKHSCVNKMHGEGVCFPSEKPTAYNKASRLIGMRVYNQTEQGLGRINEIVIDPQSGRISYAVLGVNSGFLGLGEKFLAVPSDAFTVNSAQHYLVLNAERQSVRLAKGFDRNHWPAVGTSAWGSQPFWKSDFQAPSATPKSGTRPESWNEYRESDPELEGVTPSAEDIGEAEPGVMEVAEAAPAPSMEKVTETGMEPTKFNRVHSLIGITVRDPQGEKLGTIKDVVLDLQSERVSYAVLASANLLGTTEKLYAVPLSAFRPSEDKDCLVLNADKKSMEAAQGFPANHWPSVSNPSWGAAPFWKSNPAIEKPTGTGVKGSSSMKNTYKEDRTEWDQKYPPGSLEFPGW